MSAVISSVSGWLRNVKAFFVACHWDDLFGAIHDIAAKSRWYLRERTASLQLQLACSAARSRSILHLLSEVDEVAEIYDRATLTVGQFVAHFPAQISTPVRRDGVAGLAHALRNGWAIHDGISGLPRAGARAASGARGQRAARGDRRLLEGLHGWLRDAREAPTRRTCAAARATGPRCGDGGSSGCSRGATEGRAARGRVRAEDAARARARATSGTKLRPAFSRSGAPPTRRARGPVGSSRSASSAATRS